MEFARAIHLYLSSETEFFWEVSSMQEATLLGNGRIIASSQTSAYMQKTLSLPEFSRETSKLYLQAIFFRKLQQKDSKKNVTSNLLTCNTLYTSKENNFSLSRIFRKKYFK